MNRPKKIAPKDRKKITAKDKESEDKKSKAVVVTTKNIKPSKSSMRLESPASEEKAVSYQALPAPSQKIKESQIGDLRAAHLLDTPQHNLKPQKDKSVPIRENKRENVLVEDYQLPTGYNATTLTLMARDPFWVFAYWEIAPSSIEAVRNKIGNTVFERSSYTLRMYDTTYIDFNGRNANHWFDIDVGPYTNSWYINLWHDNVTYCGEIGIKTPDGSFFALARSNFVTMPRQGSSSRSESLWMEVKDDLEEPALFIAEPQAETVGSSPLKQAGSGNLRGSRRRIFLTEEEIRAYYSRLFPVLKRVISRRQKEKSYRIFLKHPLRGGEILLEDLLIRGLSRQEFIKRILLGSSEELILRGASEFVKEGASEREQKKKKFFFDIGTELIVYGRTEPDAEVWLGNKRIKLRQDGTFTLRFALPDGKIPLDFFAQSNDKAENRSIATEVERSKTRYSPG